MTSYPIMECFYSIQGEGLYAGHAAFFIRFGGCDVGCVWCDVKDSWDAKKHPLIYSADLVELWKKSETNIVVITGGEPAMYDLQDLTNALHQAGAQIHIETSGAYELKGSFDWITFSPKKFKAALAESAASADELKIIVFNKSDFLWAEKYREMVSPQCLLYLQPEWSKQEEMQKIIFNYVLNNPHWRISLQTHKFLGVD